MKVNWKVIAAAVVIVGVIVWGVTTLRSASYSGTDLSINVGSGPFTVTNSADSSFPVELVGSGTRSFTVSSSVEGVSGSSTRAGNGSSAVQTFAFDLPPGISEYRVERGTEVRFVSEGAPSLDVTVQPMTAANAQTTLLIIAAIVIAALYYMSRATGHHWMSMFRREAAPVPVEVAPPVVQTETQKNRGRDGRMYSDS